jgi:hypothetical protein
MPNEEAAERVAHAARILDENRIGVVLTGRIVNGRVELDQSTLDRVRDGFPDAEVAFIAVNAPFDPTAQTV